MMKGKGLIIIIAIVAVLGFMVVESITTLILWMKV